MHRILAGAVLCGVALSAMGEFADYRFVPAVKAEADTTAKSVAAGAASSLKAGTVPRFQIDDFAGQSSTLKQDVGKSGLQVGEGAILGWSSGELFEAQPPQNGLNVWRASITSVDASGLRLRVNLDRLHPEDEVWLVEGSGSNAFGPFTLANSGADGRWLPTTTGDTVVVELRSPRAVMPNVTLESLSHFFESPTTKQADCPLSADCLEPESIQEVSSGIGRLFVTNEGGQTFLCSGALLNNAITDDLESLFLTADHCFQGSDTAIFADGIEVVWDFRTNGCPGTEPPNLNGLPRSTGVAFLRNSTALDGMLMELDAVPVGTRGRAYLGWDTRAPRIGDAAVGIHHPGSAAMKASLGSVNDVDVDTQFGNDQTTLSWDDGLTEGGSSGSPVMFNDGLFRVFGMLSNGNRQACGLDNPRLDQYSSFRGLFSSTSGFLSQATPPDGGRDSYSETDGPDGGGCTLEEGEVESAAANILVSSLAILTLLVMGNMGRVKP